MDRFDIGFLLPILVQLREYLAVIVDLRLRDGGDSSLTDTDKATFSGLAIHAPAVLSKASLSMPRVVDCLSSMEKSVRNDPTVARAQAELSHLISTIEAELASKIFIDVAEDRAVYLSDPSKLWLFGMDVYEKFPSARSDIRSAGECLAAECTTASVFHLMRVAEVGLRALAFDRRLVVAKKNKDLPLDLATWEDLIRGLEKAEAAIQNLPAGYAREAQFSFYHEAMLEVKRFKNVWRNRIMHARDEYDRDQAHSVLVHVRTFMQILATKISETKRTPKIWKKP